MTTHSGAAGAPAWRRLMPVLYIGVFMSALDTSVIGPAIPALRAAFGVDNREIGLVTIVFIMFSLPSTALLASLSDRHGRRPVFLGGIACFALGSLVIALAPSFWVVLLGRAIQGVGAGGIIPTASAVIGDTLPVERQGRALGLIGAVYGMAFVLGPPLAALLLVVSSWPWIFLVNLPIAAAILAMGVRVLPPTHPPTHQPPFDIAGMVVVFALLAALGLAITGVVDTLSGRVMTPWIAALVVVLLPVFVAVERRAVRPMIPLELFVNPQLARAFILSVGSGFGMSGVIFLPSIAVAAHGVSPSRVGFVLLPLVVSSMLGSMGSGRALNRVGARTLLLLAFALLAIGYGASALTSQGLAVFLAASIPVGLGLGIAVGGALRAIAIDEAPASARGMAQGLVNITSAVGTLVSAGAIGAIADANGGGAAGFGVAYVVVALVMLVMSAAALGLRRGGRIAGA